jgi:hypothetical protein
MSKWLVWNDGSISLALVPNTASVAMVEFFYFNEKHEERTINAVCFVNADKSCQFVGGWKVLPDVKFDHVNVWLLYGGPVSSLEH